jgi:hypothetical protein
LTKLEHRDSGPDLTWIAGGATIMKVAEIGGTPSTIASGQTAAAIAIDNTSIYWANANAIVRYPK